MSEATVRRDLSSTASNDAVASVTGVNGKTYTVTREPEVVAAELVDGDDWDPEPVGRRRCEIPRCFITPVFTPGRHWSLGWTSKALAQLPGGDRPAALVRISARVWTVPSAVRRGSG
jgi:hypothetical protein